MDKITLKDFFNQYWINPYNKCIVKHHASDSVEFELDSIANIKKEYEAILNDYYVYSVYAYTYTDKYNIASGCYEIKVEYYDE